MSEYRPPKEAVEEPYRLLPTVLDHKARVNPDGVYGAIPVSPNLDDGLRDFTFQDMQRAVDAFSWHLKETIGTSESFETLLYVGVNDLRYAVISFACMKTGHTVLFASGTLAPQQVSRLAGLTECTRFYHSQEFEDLAKHVAAITGGMRTQEMEDIDHWINAYLKPYPYTKTWEQARFEPTYIMTSSGSTGDPKPIPQNHQFIINMMKSRPRIEGRRNIGCESWNYEDQEGDFALCPIPFAHQGGVIHFIIMPTYSRHTAMLVCHPKCPPTPEMMLALLRLKRVRGWLSGPATLEAIVKLPGGVDKLTEIDDCRFGGGPLAKSCGDMLSKKVRTLTSAYGTTETFGMTMLELPPDEWEYIEFHPCEKPHFEEVVDGQYELVMYQNNDADYWRCAGATVLREKNSVWRTKDLWVPHPTKSNLWKFYGRTDDVIIFSTGDKWSPVEVEQHILSESRAEGVLIAGAGRTEPALLIEMEVSKGQESAALDRIWPAVEEMNAQTIKVAHINRSKVAFVQPGSFLRATKGTVMRKATLLKLKQVLDDLYDS